ncbi:protein lplB [Cohnella sp. CIP 111063]|jgi:ABC-type polysaccharide transport system, permease component|uniref:ABC transporter permease n=1 Tax=unclassified Cohnella TaxID=2636738 RepID=UPI000B8BCC97|nr:MULTISPECIES: ABC transporter permease subunit [unclassified Cohnella]OXS54067.1 protein lplB [Cohnella sp. CIP 111063]PRX62940.1 putative aldouronate transport system permease protein [Cohnella sp. SGD-V74]
MLRLRRFRDMPLHLMLLPGVILVFIYSYLPLAGIAIGFQKFMPSKGLFGSKWTGLDNLHYMLNMPGIGQVVWNTFYISSLKILFGLLVPIVIALLLNEIAAHRIKKTFQTLIYLPHFLSWIILGGILVDILSPGHGIVNQILGLFGIKPIYFLGNNDWFPFTLVASDIWKEFGFNTIVYLAALTSINPALYEAAYMDGAGRWKQTWYVTLPGMLPIIVLLATLSLGNVLNAGFDQVFNLYSPAVYESGDIIDTLVYRTGLVDMQYGVATIVGVFKSAISLVLISFSYWAAYRFANYRIF